jgi:ATP-binding cassette subfamily C protein PrsD
LADARKRGAIVVIIAHRPSAIAAVDKLLFMRDGRQVVYGSKENVLRDSTQPRIVTNERTAAKTGPRPAEIAGHG